MAGPLRKTDAYLPEAFTTAAAEGAEVVGLEATAGPGTGVLAALAGTASGVTALTGTSMAAPHVTGAIALLLSSWASSRGRPCLTRPRSGRR